MDFYNNLNEMIEYLEESLTKEIEIDFLKLARIVGVNLYTLERVFTLISGVSLKDYIRKRKLTLAAKDLVQTPAKIIDIAYKYGYNSATSFSRAFISFHGIKPKEAKKNQSHLKYYPVLKYEIPKLDVAFDYEIISLPEMTLYGLGIKTDNIKIKTEAPKLYEIVRKKYSEIEEPLYGMVVYEDRFNSNNYEYWVLWDKKYYDFEPKIIKKSKWLKFLIPSQNSKDIQEMADNFYLKFLPTCPYKIKEEPELEYYHDNITEFLIPIN